MYLPRMVAWTITRAEWMGQRITLGKQFGGMVFGLVMSMVASGFLFTWGSTWLRVLGGVAYLCVFVSLVPALRQNRRLSRSVERIWDEDGCVCPACLVSVRDRPCRHGVHAGQQALLIRYWEAVATQQVVEAMSLGRQLYAHRPWMRWLDPFWRVTFSLIDPAVPMRRRVLVAACCSLGVVLPVLLAVRFLTGVYLPGFIMLMLLAAPCWVVLTPTFAGQRGRARCTACGQELADRPPARCPECNADLAVAGAVTSVQRGQRRLTWVIGVLAAVVVSAAAPFAAMMVTWPPWVSLQLARVTGPSPLLFYELSQQQLTPSETRQAAELLLGAIERSSQRRVFANGLLAGALASGVLDESWAKRMALAGVSIRAEPRIEDGLLKVELVPTIGENLFAAPGGAGVEPRLVLLEAALDGVSMELGNTRALTDDDVNAGQRAATLAMLPGQSADVQAQLKRRLAEPDRFTITAPVEALKDGEHVLKVRFAVVVTGPAGGPYEPEFRVDGSLITPDDAIVQGQERVFPIDREVTITLPLR
jgi:hypothetical protein